jgi:hypothetical protein
LENKVENLENVKVKEEVAQRSTETPTKGKSSSIFSILKILGILIVVAFV